MLLVVMSHAYLMCDTTRLDEWFNANLFLVTQVASLAFMFVSGMIMTYLMHMANDSAQVRMKFLKRGLFLIFIIHPVLRLVTFVYADDHEGFVYNMIYDHPITDTIGLCLIVAPILIGSIKTSLRLGLVITMLLLTLAVKLWWHPDAGMAEVIRVGFFGLDPGSDSALSIGWPFVPWLAIFLCGSFVGESYAAVKQGRLLAREAAKRLRRAALILVPTGLVLSSVYMILKRYNPFAWSSQTFVALYPSRTTFLLPCYLGLLLVMVAYLVLHVDAAGKANRVYWALSLFGRMSLFTFVTQFIFVWTIPTLLGLKGGLGYFGFVITIVVGLSVCLVLAYYYGRLRHRVVAGDYQRWARLSPLA